MLTFVTCLSIPTRLISTPLISSSTPFASPQSHSPHLNLTLLILTPLASSQPQSPHINPTRLNSTLLASSQPYSSHINLFCIICEPLASSESHSPYHPPPYLTPSQPLQLIPPLQHSLAPPPTSSPTLPGHPRGRPRSPSPCGRSGRRP